MAGFDAGFGKDFTIMAEQTSEQFYLDHYITRHIKSFYKKRLIAPLIYLLLLVVLWFAIPMHYMVFPNLYDSSCSLADLYRDKERYAYIGLENLYFTGYTKEWLDNTEGYYYYTMLGEDCVIVLLRPDDCQQGLPTIEHITARCKIIHNSTAVDTLLTHLSEDLSWSKEGISSTVSPYMLSQPDATNFLTDLCIFLYVASGLYAAVCALLYALFILFPILSPPCLRLGVYGRPRALLEQAEEELKTLPQLATEDMFITEHFFIETSNFGVAIVPIASIIWIYKYSTLHKFLWHHFSISYTLYITTDKRQYIRCPKNIKSDIDGIMDYLAEANHNILVGFSEENRLKVAEIQEDFARLKRLAAFLRKRV